MSQAIITEVGILAATYPILEVLSWEPGGRRVDGLKVTYLSLDCCRIDFVYRYQQYSVVYLAKPSITVCKAKSYEEVTWSYPSEEIHDLCLFNPEILGTVTQFGEANRYGLVSVDPKGNANNTLCYRWWYSQRRQREFELEDCPGVFREHKYLWCKENLVYSLKNKDHKLKQAPLR